MTKIKFTVSYDGTDFCGWQRQNHGPLKSVQQCLEEALQKVLNEKIVLFASGRTDAGVHALAQVCHFQSQRPVEFFEKRDLAWALQAYLPLSISVRRVWVAPDDFHATLSATHKTYKYLIFNRQRRSPFLGRYTQWIRRDIDVDHLNYSSQFLLGEQDFKSFQSSGTPILHTVRAIHKAEWRWRNDEILQFSITGSGFLKQMVRNIVGTQLDLEKRRENPEKMKEIIGLKARVRAGPSAPPEGLHLWRVYYPKELDKRCREL